MSTFLKGKFLNADKTTAKSNRLDTIQLLIPYETFPVDIRWIFNIQNVPNINVIATFIKLKSWKYIFLLKIFFFCFK